MKKFFLLLVMLGICGYVYIQLFTNKTCGGPSGETGIFICPPLFKCNYQENAEQGKCILNFDFLKKQE